MRLNPKDGLTFTELLVASILIGIVMIGVASFSFVVKQMEGATNKSTLLSMRLSGAMSQMRQDALLTVGDSSSAGIQTYSNGAIRAICFRHDVNNPASYADDTWACYYYGNPDDVLKRCDNPPTVPPTSDGQCNAAPDVRQFISLSNIDFFNIVYDSDGRLDFIEMTLTSLYDLSQSVHPVNNPEQTLTTRVSPPGYGR
jgi:hypothetical protein